VEENNGTDGKVEDERHINEEKAQDCGVSQGIVSALSSSTN